MRCAHVDYIDVCVWIARIYRRVLFLKNLVFHGVVYAPSRLTFFVFSFFSLLMVGFAVTRGDTANMIENWLIYWQPVLPAATRLSLKRLSLSPSSMTLAILY